MQFTLTEEDAASLRHLASLDPPEARTWLQDHPEVAKRVANWPPEIRIEVCRILFRSFPEEKQRQVAERRRSGSDLVDLLQGE